ncbi:hypothetical protein GQ457_13G028860 [Hibiscus cannabinus]
MGIECNTTTRRLIGLSLNSTRYADEGWYLNASLFLPFVDLKSLYLSGNAIAGCIQNEGFEKLSSNLSNLEILDLRVNYLNDNIMLSLSELSSLRYLSLANNHLEGSSDRNGFQWLSRLSNLETLDLSGNSLKNNIMLHMNGLSSLKTLSLGGNLLKGKLLHIQELNNLTKLKYLDLSGNKIDSISNQDETHLRLLNLEELDLSYNLFRNNTFSFPKGLSSLKSLKMCWNDLQGSLDIKGLENLTNLKELDVSGNRIESLESYKGFQWLSRLNNLETLYLSGNSLKNNIMLHMKGLSSLKTLSLRGNLLKGNLLHIQGWMLELNNLTKLKYLDLSGNRIESISNQDETHLRLLNLEELDLSYNLFRNNTFFFPNGLSNLKSLTMIKNDLQGLLDIKGLENLANLKELDLSENGIESLESYKDDATKRQQMIHLEELYLDENLLYNSSTVFASLSGFPNLKSLSMRSNQLKGSLDMKDLDAVSNLRELYLTSNQLKDFVIQKGCCDLKKLEVLDLSGNAFEGMLPNYLGNLTSLRELDVSDNHFSGNLTPLSNLTSLEYLSLSRNHLEIPTSFAPFVNLRNLKVFYADENKMVMEPSFHSSLPKFQLRFISLPNCITSPDQLGFELLTFLHYQYDLRFVDLSGNKFSGTPPIWLLENNTKLEFLILRGNAFSGLLSLPSAPNLNASLVDISDNKLQGQIPSHICSTFPHLRGLFLSKNAIEGHIPPCLSGMMDLSTLDLSNNQLSGRLPDELIMKKSLFMLRLSNNNLSGNVIPAVFNTNRLIGIHLDGNNFSGEMEKIDVSIFEFSSSPAEIDLSNNKLYGKLPGWIGNLSSLQSLALSNNRFEGSIPKEFCNLNSYVVGNFCCTLYKSILAKSLVFFR